MKKPRAAKTVTITARDRADALRLLAELEFQQRYVINSNTPPCSDQEKHDLEAARKIQAEAMDLAARLRRAK